MCRKTLNMTLPVLDLSVFTQGNAQERQGFGQELLASLQAHGFVKLANYGLPREYIDTLMMWVSRMSSFELVAWQDCSQFFSILIQCERFFQLSRYTKAAIINQKGPKPQRGYSGIGEENFDTFALDGIGGSYTDVKVS